MFNQKIFAVLLFITSVGMCAGAFFEVFMEGSGKEQLMDFLSVYITDSTKSSFLSIFFSSSLSLFKPWLFFFLCPLIPLLALACPFLCMLRGLSVGFASTMLIETFGFKGAWYIILSIMPQNIIQLPVFCLLSALSMSMSVISFKCYTHRHSRKKYKNALQVNARHYIFVFALCLFLLLISCLIDVVLKVFLL